MGARMATQYGGSGKDTLAGTSGSDTLIGQGDDDALYGGGGTDYLYGGAGNDSIDGGSGDDRIEGGADNDSLYGGDGYDQLYGDAGNDTLFGGTDGTYDDLYGGTGDDTLYGGNAYENWQFGGDGNDSIYGGTDYDLIYGGDDDDLIYGNDGDDDIDGGAGSDTIYSGDGSDTVYGNDGADTIYGHNGAIETLYGGAGEDTIFGGAGDDIIQGEQDDDLLYGGDGDDLFNLSNGAASDTIYGGADHDTIDFVSDDAVTISSTAYNAGTYTQAGGASNGIFDDIEEIRTGAGDDDIDLNQITHGLTITAGDGADTITTGSNHDVIDAGAGADTLTGGAGHDTLTGGAGDDTFVFTQSGGADVITDFDTGDSNADGTYNDQLDVSGLQNPDGSPISVGDVRVENDGSGNAKLIFPEGESVVLQGVTPAQMATPAQLHAAGIPCFTPGAMIATEQGERSIETLQVGDRVFTRDHGMQPIRWIGRRSVAAEGRLAPVLIAPTVMRGQSAPLLVSPQHRLLFTGYRAELLFAEREVFVSAAHLVDGTAVTRRPGGVVTYLHLMFDNHEVIYANGVPTESFHPGEEAINGVDAAAREELFRIFPELRADLSQFGRTARRCLRGYETEMLQV